jgi:hypothetical protein
LTSISTTRHSLTLVKSFGYRGAPEEWSNTYFFTGDLPSTPAAWKTLADNVIAQEKTLYDANTEVVKAIGHQAGDSVAVWSYDYAAASESVPGTLTIGVSTVPQGGDSASWLRWSTDQLTSKGKPIYLRSYFHPAYAGGSTDSTRDEVSTNWTTPAQAFGDAWIAGFSDGSETHVRCGPKGAVGLVALPSTYVTTRTLERRGKRPT